MIFIKIPGIPDIFKKGIIPDKPSPLSATSLQDVDIQPRDVVTVYTDDGNLYGTCGAVVCLEKCLLQ